MPVETNQPTYLRGTDDSPNAGAAYAPAPPPASPAQAQQLVNMDSDLLARFLVANDYHPVILCGTSSSGKTTMLASLCAHLSTCGTVGFEFGEWYDFGDSSEAKDQFDEAQHFFRDVVRDFRDNIAPDSTHIHLPYMVPLKVTPTDTSAMPRGKDGRLYPAKFAIMDIRGEFFKEDLSGTGIYRPLQLEMAAFLRSFERGVTMIYLAPVSRIDGYRLNPNQAVEPHNHPDLTIRRQEDPDSALMNAIMGYQAVRAVRARDRHLFLLTKWDLHTRGTEAEAFSTPTREGVESVLRELYPTSWAAFQAMRASASCKWLMQYSAGLISGRQVMKQAGESRERLQRYAKIMWNWLYEGAIDADPDQPVPALFPEVLPRTTPWYERFLTGRGRR